MTEDTSSQDSSPRAKNKTKRRSSKKATKKKASSSKTGKKLKPWTFPKNTLEDAIRIPRAIEDKNAGNPMKASVLAQAVGFNLVTDWRFQDLLRSANQYGLVSGSGTTATVRMEKIGEDVVAPSSSTQRQSALLAAFRNVDDFAKVESFYGNKRIPEDEFFENTLAREFNIDRNRVKTFVEVFTENLKYLNLFNARRDSSEAREGEPESGPGPEVAKEPRRTEPRVREFLDSCFVMMPFGDWFDRYYKEIYVPAVKEAGFEPVRSDELFATGSVMEQIWEQVQKATVLLADVTGKNANVFYELGLSHAAYKPVVLTAGSIDDVPFDLRHLRVIIYDVREPQWDAKLGKAVTDYLKNSKADPSKSIPQPFRDGAKKE